MNHPAPITDHDAGDECRTVRPSPVGKLPLIMSAAEARRTIPAAEMAIIDTDYRLMHILSMAEQREGGFVIQNTNGSYSAAVLIQQENQETDHADV